MKRSVTAIAAGALLGVLYAVTPVTFWAAVLAGIAVGSAAVGLPGADRRALLLICVAALGVRAIAVAAMLVMGIPQHNDLATGALAGDEAYNLSRALRTRDVLLDRPVSKYDHVVVHDEYGYSSYLSLLTWVQIVAGPTPYSMRLLNAVLFLSGGLLLFRVVQNSFGRLTGLCGLALLLVVPSLAAASTSLLKESAYFACSALLVWCTVLVLQGARPSHRYAGVLLAIAAFALLDDLRRGGFVLAVAGIAMAVGLRLALWRWWTAAAASVAAIAVVVTVLATPALQQRLIGGLESAAKLHSGHVFTVGHAYKLLDAGFYVNPQATSASTLTLTPDQAFRFVVRGVGSFVLMPLPWQMVSTRELLFLPELILWYVLVLLVPLGVVAGWRKDPLLTSLLLCFPIPTAVALALTTGNVGTLLRLRGLVLPYLLWLGVLGLLSMLAWRTRTTGPASVTVGTRMR